MRKLCDQGNPQDHSNSRQDFLKATALAGAAATAATLLSGSGSSAQSGNLP